MMTDPVMIALISSAGGVLSGAFGLRGYDKLKNGRHAANGNGASVERAIASRAEVEFQTRMTILMGQLTDAIEKGHDKALSQMQAVSVAINDAAGAIRQVHEEIVTHREAVQPALQASFDTLRVVKDIQQRLERGRNQ